MRKTVVIFIQLIIGLSFFCRCGSVEQKIEIFSPRGESVTLRDKIPDLYDWRPLIVNANYYCVIGQWLFFDEINYQGNWVSLSGTGTNEIGYEEMQCKNRTFSSFKSAKYRGTRDTATPSLEFTEGTNFGCFGGNEIVVENYAPSFELDSAECIRANGKQNWTLFSEDNYEGNSQCLKSDGNEIQYVGMETIGSVRSARKGCV